MFLKVTEKKKEPRCDMNQFCEVFARMGYHDVYANDRIFKVTLLGPGRRVL